MVTSPYNDTDFAFTLDPQYYQFSTTEEDTYFLMEIDITYYNFYSNVSTNKVVKRKIPLFNKQQEYYIGEIVHRVLSSIKELDTAALQYKTPRVIVTVKEQKYIDDSVLSTEVFPVVKFIAGPKPKLFSSNIGLLNNNINYTRVTQTGFFNFNVVLPDGNHQFKILKNSTEVNSEIIVATTTDNVFTKHVKFSNYNAKLGDVFTLLIDTTTNIEKKVVIFPDQPHSNMLLFENEFKVLSSLELTGEYSFPDSYKRISQKYIRKTQETVEIIKVNKTERLKINSGWIVKDNLKTIDSLFDSKKAWLLFNNTVIELIPESNKKVGEDSTKPLFQYDLEFLINPSIYAQDYTF